MKSDNLHRDAMEIADQGDIASLHGEERKAIDLNRKATDMELEAARLCDKEPSRSILYASAAALAFRSGEFKTAEKIIEEGRSKEGVEGPGVMNMDELSDLLKIFHALKWNVLSYKEITSLVTRINAGEFGPLEIALVPRTEVDA